jgi:apolipoprotein N-acyltransferase
MIHKRKTHTGKIVALTLIVLLSAVGYDYLHAQPAAADGDLTSSAAASSTSVDQLLGVVNEIQNIQLDGSIFQDPAFLSLQDDTTTLPPEAIGRNNPFAPLSSSQAAAKTTKSN